MMMMMMSNINQCSKKNNRTSSVKQENGNKINFTHLQPDKKNPISPLY